MSAWTKGPWTVRVFEPCSVGMSTMSNEAFQSLAHAVVSGDRDYTVAHTEHKVADIVWEPIDRDYVRSKTIKSYKLDRTPHPDALLCAAAPEMAEALEGMLAEWDKFTRYGSPIAKASNERVNFARAALAKARGQKT